MDRLDRLVAEAKYPVAFIARPGSCALLDLEHPLDTSLAGQGYAFVAVSGMLPGTTEAAFELVEGARLSQEDAFLLGRMYATHLAAKRVAEVGDSVEWLSRLHTLRDTRDERPN